MMQQQEVQRIEALLDDLERLGDPAARATATELVQALLDMYGEGLRRIAERVDMRELAGDELVGHLLFLHGLHPVPVQERVAGALDEMRPYLDAHGGDVRLLGIEDGVVRLQLQGSCSGCPSSAVTLRHGIEEAIHRAAPDVERIEAEDAPAEASPPALLQIDNLVCPLPEVKA
jgi:Fe-S cluster biogenesis protein NfuA